MAAFKKTAAGESSRKSCVHGTAGCPAGFTLLEVMVALVLGTLIVGGVMGLISVSMQYSQRVKDKIQVQPVLEAAAQEILTHPEIAEQDSLTLKNLPKSPTVGIALAKVELPGDNPGKLWDSLYRVKLYYRESMLELSMIIPPSEGFGDQELTGEEVGSGE